VIRISSLIAHLAGSQMIMVQLRLNPYFVRTSGLAWHTVGIQRGLAQLGPVSPIAAGDDVVDGR
jgi:hypothetical protein